MADSRTNRPPLIRDKVASVPYVGSAPASFAKPVLISSAVHGSYLYGTETPESDVDVSFLYMTSLADCLLRNGRTPLHMEMPGVKDVIVGHHFRDAVRDVLTGRPNLLHHFFPEQTVIKEPGSPADGWHYIAPGYLQFCRKVRPLLVTHVLTDKLMTQARAFFHEWDSRIHKGVAILPADKAKACKYLENGLRNLLLVSTLKGYEGKGAPLRFRPIGDERTTLMKVKEGRMPIPDMGPTFHEWERKAKAILSEADISEKPDVSEVMGHVQHFAEQVWESQA